MHFIAPTSPRSTHLFAATLLVFWLTTHQSVSQLREVALGTVRSLPTPENFDSFRVLNSNTPGTRQLLLWSLGSTVLWSTQFPFSESSLGFRARYALEPFDDVLSADFTGDGMDEILLVHRGERRISIITNLTADTLRPLTVLHLPVEPTCVIVGDVNNDKRLDILVADRKNLGVIPFLGVGRGQFRQAAVIAPDSAVEDMLLLYLNNDMLLDLVFYDWVNSELHFSYGVGRGRFVDLTLLPVEGTVKKMYATKLGRNRFIDLVLLVDQPPELQIWEGDVTGDFHKRNTFSVAHPAAALDVADFNNDGWNDFIFLDRKDVLRVVLNSPDGNNPFWLEYATGRGARQVLAADVNSDGRMDAIVLQREPRQLLVYSNAAQEHVLRDSLQFSVGVEPRGLWIGDVDGDGDNDVVVVNRGSGALSLLAGRGAKGLIGQTMVPIADGPQQLSFHSSSDSTVNFFVSYPSTRSISYLSIRREDLSTVNALIPGVGVMELLYANSTAQGQAEFFCYNLASGTRSPSLVFYQQLGQQTFIERTFRLTIPDVLLGAALGDINKDGIVDIAFAYHNNDLGRNEIIFSLGDSALSFRQRFQTVSLLGENSRRSHMWLRDFDRNDTLDLLLVFPKTEKTIMLAKGTKDRKFEPPRLVQGDIALTDRSQLQILDFNGDGILDLLVHNSATNTLGWLQGKGDGSFTAWRPLLQDIGVDSFAFGDLNNDGVLDLAVTVSDEGVVRLYDGKLLLQHRRAGIAR